MLALAERPDHVSGVIARVARQRTGVAGGDPSLPAIGDREFGKHFEGSCCRIIGFVDMHVDVCIEFACDLEHDFDMAAAILRRGFVERHAADDIDAAFHHLPHQRFGARRFDDAFLRKGNDLDIDQVAKALAFPDQAFGRPRAADRIDIDMAPQPRNAVFDGPREHARGTVGNFLDRVMAFDFPEYLDRLRERPRNVDRGALRDQRLVEMNMRFDKTRHGHSAIGVERGGRNHGRRTALDAREPAISYPDVAQVFGAPQSDVFNENVQRHQRAPFGCIDRHSLSTASDDVQRSSTASIQFTRFDACCTLRCRVASNVLYSERIVMSVAPISSIMRLLLVSFGTLSLLLTTPQAQAQDKVLRVGTLKLIHGIAPYFYEKFAPPGYTVEVIPFESPTDGKNAVLTGTVDTCIHGIAAFILGAAAGEPGMIVAQANNRGIAGMARV